MCEVILDFLFALNHQFEGLCMQVVASSIYIDMSVLLRNALFLILEFFQSTYLQVVDYRGQFCMCGLYRSWLNYLSLCQLS